MDIPEGMELPDIKTVKGKVRKTLVGEDGMTYETEEEVKFPEIIHDNEVKKE